VVRFSPCINKVILDDSSQTFFSNMVSQRRRSTQALETMARLTTWQALKKKKKKEKKVKNEVENRGLEPHCGNIRLLIF
jgi:hypothetical protein